MKKNTKCFDVSKLHIIAFAVVIAFSMAACPDKGDDNGNGNGDGNGGTTIPTTTSFGNTMTLSGKVYLYEVDIYNGGGSYSPFNGNMTINCPYGGTGQITNGNLNYTIGTPLNLETFDFEDFFEGSWDNVNVTPSRTVRGVFFESLPTNSNNYSDLGRRLATVNVRNNSYSETFESVIYFYVNNDVTVTARGINRENYWDGGTYTYITRDINLAFKAGWNTVYVKEEISSIYQNQTVNYATTRTTTTTVSMSNPSNLRWVTQERYPTYQPPPLTTATDSRLNGTWSNNVGDEISFYNGNFTFLKGNDSYETGTFSTYGNTITYVTQTIAYDYFDIGRLFTKEEVLEILKLMSLDGVISDEELAKVNKTFNLPTVTNTNTYSVDGNKLTMTFEDGRKETYTRQSQ